MVFMKKTKKAYEYSVQIACEDVDNIRMVAALIREDDLWKIYHNLLDEPCVKVLKMFSWPPYICFCKQYQFFNKCFGILVW